MKAKRALLRVSAYFTRLTGRLSRPVIGALKRQQVAPRKSRSAQRAGGMHNLANRDRRGRASYWGALVRHNDSRSVSFRSVHRRSVRARAIKAIAALLRDPARYLPVAGVVGLALVLFVVVQVAGAVRSGGHRNVADQQLSAQAIYDRDAASLEDAARLLGYAVGAEALGRTRDLLYVVSAGDTLSDIAFRYNVGRDKLAYFNQLEDPHKLAIGDEITIPSAGKVELIADEEVAEYTAGVESRRLVARSPINESGAVRNFRISAQTQRRQPPLEVRFAIEDPAAAGASRFQWNFDSAGRYTSSDPSVGWTFRDPGTYRVSVRALNQGRWVQSHDLFVDVPYPASYRDEQHRFVTLGNLEQTFTVNGEVVAVQNYADLAASPLEIVERGEQTLTLRSTQPGYFNVQTELPGGELFTTFVYVSPLDSVHAVNENLNWYRTQHNTGTYSNCGPSVVSMCIAFSTGEYVPVSAIRQFVGWREDADGGTSFGDLLSGMQQHGVPATFRFIDSENDLFRIVDAGNVAVVLYRSGAVVPVSGDPRGNSFGRFYNDDVGHYVVVKGYTRDRRYFIVYDPMPHDWGANSFRQADGVSMIGRNRFYPVSDIMNSLRTRRIIEVPRMADG